MRKRYSVLIIICLFMVLLNVLSRLCSPFADFYTERIFPLFSNPVSFLTGLLPFSVGEIFILFGILLVLVGVPCTVLLLIFGKNFRKKTASTACFICLLVFTFILTTETMNCFIMYQCTPFSEKYLKHSDHTESQITELYFLLIEKTNDLAEKVPRDDMNCFEFTKDVNPEAKKAMKKAGDTFPQLKGYYPKAKPIQFSYFMSQSHLTGIYFPFSLESNYNDDMCRTNLPETVCHEFSHLKGFIQEDEANFISFYATTQCSDNLSFQYSGYLSALEYVHNEIYNQNISGAFYLTDNISDNVRRDWFRFMPDNYWEENVEKEVIPTETVSTVSTTAIDTNIKANGRTDGIKSYSLVVELLLDFYYPA
ncbi:MAG: DUF3810 domain-containing protein [Ruminococcus sp.]|nr:DUF3810 domain-containing protein [Ruminococcus sp.]